MNGKHIMTIDSSQKIQTGLGVIMAAVGLAGVLAPSRLGVSTGAAESSDESRYLTQLWTMREAALGSILLGTRKSTHRRSVLGVVVGLAAAEMVVGLQTPALNEKGRLSAAGSAAVFTAAGIWALWSS
jgi:hypothetical protein